MELARFIATCTAAGMHIPHALQGLELRVDTQAAMTAIAAPQPGPCARDNAPHMLLQLQRVVDEGAGVLQGQARFLARMRAQMGRHVAPSRG